MYTLKVSYGDVDDEPETATVEILGTYGSWDEACEAAKSKFDAIMELLGDDIDKRFREVKESLDNYYVTYGYYDDDIGYVDNEHYYMVSVIER